MKRPARHLRRRDHSDSASERADKLIAVSDPDLRSSEEAHDYLTAL